MNIRPGLGTFRLFLAFLVAISHLWAGMLHGPAAYAVWGFFVLSGFLMTFVLTRKYGITSDGVKKYLFNRFIRIYPSYILCALLGLAVLLLIGKDGDTTCLNPDFLMPQSAKDWICNVLMIPNTSKHLLVPVAGALFIEMWAYVLMPFSAKSKSAAWLGLAISMSANYLLGMSDPASFIDRYSSFTPALAGFFVGSLCCHYYDTLRRFSKPAISVVVWCLHCLIVYLNCYYPWTAGMYVSLLLSAWVVVSLFGIKSGPADKLLGDASYLVYLLHTTVGMCFYPLWGERSFAFFAVSFAVTFILSIAIVTLYERPIQRRFKKI